MRESKVCPKCGSGEVIARARVMAQGHMNVRHDLEIRTDADPGAILMTEAVYSRLAASVCCDCGHVELFVPDPAPLHRAWRAAQEKANQTG